MIPSTHGGLIIQRILLKAEDLNPHLCVIKPTACFGHVSARCTLKLLLSSMVHAATCGRPNFDSLLIFQALSQLLCLLPWPWWHPSPVASPGLPPPMQSPTTTAQGLSGPLFGAYTLPTFKFQPRRESVDWRRISALDVDRVARELDVATLQENIAGVTFCNLDREVCGRCGQPVDPVLLKVLRLAQLSIEYLLHCQDCLSTSVAQLEARLQASLGQQERGQQELGRQADELKGVREESRRRRKMISALQQLLLQTGAHSYHTVSTSVGRGPWEGSAPSQWPSLWQCRLGPEAAVAILTGAGSRF